MTLTSEPITANIKYAPKNATVWKTPLNQFLVCVAIRSRNLTCNPALSSLRFWDALFKGEVCGAHISNFIF
jgi:hypothetical protein